MIRRLQRRFALALAGGVTFAAAGLVGAAPAQAAACTGTSGVTVVVQSGGTPTVKCASGDPSSATAALKAAGFSVTPVQQFPGAICRIGGYPSSDPCVRMPPADAYWAFFHASAGGSWTYSQSGAGSYNPKPGSSVGFRFGSGSAPSAAPAAPAPPKPPSTPKPKPPTKTSKPTTTKSTSGTTTAPKGGAGPTPATPRPGSTTPPPGKGSATPSASGSASGGASTSPSASTSATAAPSSEASSTPSATSDAEAAPRSDDTGSSGSASLVGGGVLLAGLAAAVAAVAVRRRSLQ